MFYNLSRATTEFSVIIRKMQEMIVLESGTFDILQMLQAVVSNGIPMVARRLYKFRKEVQNELGIERM